MMYLKKISAVGKLLYPSLLWRLPSGKKILYLTFDDGPNPEITPWVLNILNQYQAKATFFCVGENVTNYPDVFNQLITQGHRIGNHTYNHLKGWKTSKKNYLENVRLAKDAILKNANWQENEKVINQVFSNSNQSPIPKTEHSNLFRPPYGMILPGQIKRIQQIGYKIVMWDVISGDFDSQYSAEDCYQNVIKNCGSGSIVVFHDSKKASKKLKEVLPGVLTYFQNKGFEFKAI